MLSIVNHLVQLFIFKRWNGSGFLHFWREDLLKTIVEETNCNADPVHSNKMNNTHLETSAFGALNVFFGGDKVPSIVKSVLVKR